MSITRRGMATAIFGLAVLFGSGSALAQDSAKTAATMDIKLKNGTVTIQLRPDLAPKHVERLKELAKEGAYDNVAFHRVIDGFMAQTGDVQYGKFRKTDENGEPLDEDATAKQARDLKRAGTGSSKKADLPAEFTDKAKFERGTVGMARAQDPNSANSQFFIMFEPAPSLDGQYTIVGEVTEGMEHVDAIKRGEGPNGAVLGEPDVMLEVTVNEPKAG